MTQKTFHYGSDTLNVSKAIQLAEGKIKGGFNNDALHKIRQSQQHVEQMVKANRTVYGITTGFGILAGTKISDKDAATLQYKILQSHSVGVGDPVPADIARLMLVTKVHALSQGYSGVRMLTIERMLWHLENDVLPVVPEKGSVGASGDLAPLAHLFLPLIGLGEVFYKGSKHHTKDVLHKFGLQPIQLSSMTLLAISKFLKAPNSPSISEKTIIFFARRQSQGSSHIVFLNGTVKSQAVWSEK